MRRNQSTMKKKYESAKISVYLLEPIDVLNASTLTQDDFFNEEVVF